MINRTLIRLKIVQLIYAFYQNGGKNIDTAEKELLFSLSKAYDLYNYMLLLIVSVSRYAFQEVEHKEQMNRVAHIQEEVSHRFADNLFAAQLEKTNSCKSSLTQKRKHGTTTLTTSRNSMQTSFRVNTMPNTWEWTRSPMPMTVNCGASFTRTSL
jgi:hypothetical protein